MSFVLFDLDNTLVDSLHLKELRDRRSWPPVYAQIPTVPLFVGVAEVWEELRGSAGRSRRGRARRDRGATAGRSRSRPADALRSPLAGRFRHERPILQRLLLEPASAPDALQPAFAARRTRSDALRPLIAELRTRLHEGPDAIVPSYVHMFVNRLTRSADQSTNSSCTTISYSSTDRKWRGE